MGVNSPVFLIDGLNVLISGLFVVFALLIYWKVRSDGNLAMDSFQLNEDEVLQDYRIIFFGNLILLAGFGFHILAALDIVSILIYKVITTLYILVIMIVLFRWVRIFR